MITFHLKCKFITMFLANVREERTMKSSQNMCSKGGEIPGNICGRRSIVWQTFVMHRHLRQARIHADILCPGGLYNNQLKLPNSTFKSVQQSTNQSTYFYNLNTSVCTIWQLLTMLIDIIYTLSYYPFMLK